MNVTILGSTGSIGLSTLDVVRRHGDRVRVHALVAGRNVEVLCSQIREFRPSLAVVADAEALDRLSAGLPETGLARRDWPELAAGADARVAAAIAPEVGFVMSA